MIEVPIFDAAFEGQAAANANGDNLGRSPAYFRWRHLQFRAEVKPGDQVWVTDSALEMAASIQRSGAKTIAWLLEPRELHSENYDYVLAHRDDFWTVLSHDREMVDAIGGRYVPWGGTRIAPADWRLHPKTRGVSIVASPKRGLHGHRLRHAAVTALGDRIEAFGPEYRPMDRKLESLADFRYQVVFENSQRDCWFTEHLIDCLLTGTVPVYWGCTPAAFNPAGIIQVTSLADLITAFPYLHEEDYERRAPALRDNLVRALDYTLTEDWLWRNYPDLFIRSFD